MSKFNKTTEWAAGLLEGEGYFGCQKKSGQWPYIRSLRATINMIDLDVLEDLAKVFPNGARLNYKPRKRGDNKPIYHLQWTGQNAYNVMVEILPYMSRRRIHQIADAVIEFQCRPGGRATKYLEEV